MLTVLTVRSRRMPKRSRFYVQRHKLRRMFALRNRAAQVLWQKIDVSGMTEAEVEAKEREIRDVIRTELIVVSKAAGDLLGAALQDLEATDRNYPAAAAARVVTELDEKQANKDYPFHDTLENRLASPQFRMENAINEAINMFKGFQPFVEAKEPCLSYGEFEDVYIEQVKRDNPEMKLSLIKLRLFKVWEDYSEQYPFNDDYKFVFPKKIVHQCRKLKRKASC